MFITYRNHPMFAPDGDAGAAGSEGAGAQSQDAGKTADASGTNGGQQASGGEGKDKPLTQEDIDAIVEKRLKRAKQTWEQEEKDKAALAAKPEIERLQGQNKTLSDDLTNLQKQVRERDAKDAVADAAKKAGATDASPIWKMVKSDLEFNEDGTIKNLDAAIKDAKAIAPQLFKPATGKADGGAGSGARAPKSGDWIRQLTSNN